MNKIPELTKEHNYLLQKEISIINRHNSQNTSPQSEHFDIFYREILKIADQQGLLSKEASLALKPDNWIEWGNNSETRYGGISYAFIFTVSIDADINICFIHIKDKNKNTVDRIQFENVITKHPNFGEFGFNASELLRWVDFPRIEQTCQNWLDNYLKEQK